MVLAVARTFSVRNRDASLTHPTVSKLQVFPDVGSPFRGIAKLAWWLEDGSGRALVMGDKGHHMAQAWWTRLPIARRRGSCISQCSPRGGDE